MSVLNQYQRFLASPEVNKKFLADNASFHYITSGVSVNSPDAIVKYLQVESRHINKRVEKVISSVVTADSLVLEVETEFEFVISGANYLPGLDDNFLADHVVLLPIIHFVSLKNGQVTQVRLFWDQATMLKQLEVIGRTGRNWPIKDGKDQVLMIRKSVEAQGFSSSESSAPANGNAAPARTAQSGPSARSSSPTPQDTNQGRIRNDPRTSLNLYGEEEVARPVQPRGNSGYRPPSRDLAAILGDDSEDHRSHSNPVIAPKARSSFSRGKSFDVGEVIAEAHDSHNNKHIPPKGQASMMKGQTFSLGAYDEDDQEPTPRPQSKGNVNSKKYAHFDLGNGEDAPGEPQITAKSKHAKHETSRNFDDFSTPEKKPVRRDDARHHGWGDDDEAPAVNNRPLTNISNTQTQAQNNAHRNDSHQFEIADNSPANNKRAQKVQHSDDEDNFFSQMSSARTERGIRIAGNGQGNRKEAHNQTQAESNQQRNDGHFEIGDNSPANNKRAPKVQHNDDEDNFFSQMSSTRTDAGIRIAGNGQGNRKEQTQAESNQQRNDGHFEIGYNSPEAKRAPKVQHYDDEDNFFSQMSSTRTDAGIRIAGNGQGNRKEQTQAQSNQQRNDGHFDMGYNSPEVKRAPKPQHNDDEDNFFSQMSSTRTDAGIRIAGNGQGNRKATESHWGHGDDSPRAPMPGKQQRVEAEKEKDTSGGGFWDY